MLDANALALNQVPRLLSSAEHYGAHSSLHVHVLNAQRMLPGRTGEMVMVLCAYVAIQCEDPCQGKGKWHGLIKAPG